MTPVPARTRPFPGLEDALFELTRSAVYVCEAPTGRIVRYNDRAAELWGRRPSPGDTDQRFCGALRLWLPDGTALPHDRTPMAEAMRTGRGVRDREVVIGRPDGSRITVRVGIQPLHDADGRVVGAVNVFDDITAQRDAELLARRTEARLQRVLDTLPMAAYTCDAEGLITYCNEAAVRLWGRSPRLADPTDRFCGSFRLYATDGTPIDHGSSWMAMALQHESAFAPREIVVERENGERRTVLAHATPLHDADGSLLGAVNILVDVTAHKQIEQALRTADRRKDEFLAVLAHELRNPLAPIRTGLDLLRLAVDDVAAAARIRGTMERQVAQLVRLVDDLLDVSRITRGRFELRRGSVRLDEVVRTAVDVVAPAVREREQRLAVELPDEAVTLEADAARLSQVVLNLLANATRYTAPRGTIELRATVHDGELVLTVSDSGRGIAKEMLDRVFEMFVREPSRDGRGHEDGLGVGLTLARSIVELHGGTIRAASEGPGRGSTFTVRLPLTSRPPLAQEGRTVETEPLTSRRVLVVDDNRDAVDALALLFRSLGQQVEVAYDGASALRLAHEFAPEVAFVDLGLPDMRGTDVVRQLRERSTAGVRPFLVALTGWGQEEDRRRTQQAGFDRHLVKPASFEELHGLLAELDERDADGCSDCA